MAKKGRPGSGSKSGKQSSGAGGNWWSRLGLTTQIVLAMLVGALLGVVLHEVIGYDEKGMATSGFGSVLDSWLVEGVFYVGGQIFVRGLKLLVVPLVFCSLVCGVALLGGHMGRVSGRTVGLYIGTTAIAITLALLTALMVDPGSGIALTTMEEFEPRPVPAFAQVLVDIFPSNPIAALAEGNMLQIIVFALLFGFIMNRIGSQVESVQRVIEQLNEIFVSMVLFIVRFAPYGVLCLVGHVFASKGLGVFFSLAKYFFVVLGVLVLQAILVYGSLIRWGIGQSPRAFFLRVRELLMVAFSTSSSNATLPVTLRTMTQNLGVNRSIASFTAPLGATINMDGTAIMQGTATVFIASAYGLDLTVTEYLMVILTASLASIGTAGVPGAGLIMLALVLEQAGLPVEGIGLILGVDRLLDMARTSVNVCGDCVISCLVAKGEGELDETAFEASQKAYS